MLLAGETVLGTVAGVRAGGGSDVVMGEDVGRRLGVAVGEKRAMAVGKLELVGEMSVEARGTGPYSLITQRPLKHGGFTAQGVDAAQVGWLRSRGMVANVGELVSLKCDDVGNRRRLREAMEGRGEFPRAGAPYSLWVLMSHLIALGLEVQAEGAGDHVGLRLGPARDAEIVARSSGEVRKPETINYRSYRPERGGLFCEEVFGPDRPNPAGEGGRGDARHRSYRFGHVPLPTPIVPYVWRAGSPGVLGRLLGLTSDEVERVVMCEAVVRRKGDSVWLMEFSHELPPPPPEEGEEELGLGGDAIAAMLARVDEARVPAGLRGRLDGLVQRHVPVLPPDLRPLVLLENGNFATSDLNDLYRRVINRANRLRKLMELSAPKAILVNEQGMLQQAVDQLMANRSLKDRATGDDDEGRPLSDVLGWVLGEGLVGSGLKRVDYSGCARAVVDETLGADRVGVPRKVHDELRLSDIVPVLVTRRGVERDGGGTPSGAFAALYPVVTDGPVIRLPRSVFERLELIDEAEGVARCAVHRPLGGAAVEEVKGLVMGRSAATTAGGWTSWLDEADAPRRIGTLVRAAVQGEVVHLGSDLGVMVGGAGAVEFSRGVGADSAAAEEAYREVPEPK